MNEIFKESLRKFVLVFFDDILEYSRTTEEHQHHLYHVLSTLENHQLFANGNKCHFGKSSVEYLGHIISSEGVAADNNKIQVMLNWPPLSLTALSGFLGLTGYYHRFVANYGSIAVPLTELLKKYNFHWGPQVETAFQTLKTAISKILVLALPDFTKSFIVETEAS